MADILKELLTLSEAAKVKNLIGCTLETTTGKKVLITNETKDEDWSGNFYADSIRLTSIEGCPRSVSGNFGCRDNNLVSLEGAPSSIGGYFSCWNNNLTSLKDINKIVKKVGDAFYAGDNPIKSHVLGLLLIKGCKEVELDNKQVEEILNRYLPNTRGNKALLECQSELLDANLEDYAEL